MCSLSHSYGKRTICSGNGYVRLNKQSKQVNVGLLAFRNKNEPLRACVRVFFSSTNCDEFDPYSWCIPSFYQWNVAEKCVLSKLQSWRVLFATRLGLMIAVIVDFFVISVLGWWATHIVASCSFDWKPTCTLIIHNHCRCSVLCIAALKLSSASLIEYLHATMDLSSQMFLDIPKLISHHYKEGNLNWPMMVYISLVHVVALIGLTRITACSPETLLWAFILWPIR